VRGAPNEDKEKAQKRHAKKNEKSRINTLKMSDKTYSGEPI
jgi:hypothetical protein